MSTHRQKILFVSARLPFPTTEGHQIRTFGVLTQLQKNNEIHLLSVLRPNEQLPEKNALTDVCSSIRGVSIRINIFSNIIALLKSTIKRLPIVVTKYINAELEEEFKKAIAEINPDIVHFDLLHLVQLSSFVPSTIKMVLNQHNVESDLVFQRANNTSNIFLKLILSRDARLLSTFEKSAVSLVSATLACSEADRISLLAMGANRVVTIPNGVDTKELTPSFKIVNKKFVFLGGMGWYPNKQGMEWFIENVMPVLKLANNEVQVDVIGNPKPMLNIPESYKDNINITGFVDDFKPIIRDSLAMIVPLTVGSGTRLKVLEGMSLGKCIVSTEKGAQGIDLEDDKDIIFANSGKEFASAMLQLLDNNNKAIRIGREARNTAVDKYEWDVIGEYLNALYFDLD